MKIYYISDSRIPSRFANSVHVMKMCRSFADDGHDVTLFAKSGEEDKEDVFDYYGVSHSFKLERLKPYNWLRQYHRIPYVLQLKGKITELGLPDMFYSRNSYALATLAGYGVPVVFEAHTPPRNSVELYCVKKLFKNKSFKRLVVISANLKKMFIDQFPQLDEKIIMIAHDCADINDTQPQYFSDNNKLKIGYVGHLYSGRGIDIILKAAQKLKDCEFHIIGGFEQLINEWKSSPLMGENTIFHGFVSPQLTDQLRMNMDILLAPYQKSVAVANNQGNTVEFMSPLKIFEYMAAGKAIIASDLPAIREVLSNHHNALLVKPDDVNEWVGAINRLKDNKPFREQIGGKAKELFLAQYTWCQRAKQVLAGINQD